MATNARGGVMKSLGRIFTGESIFMSSYTAETNGAKIAFATTVPGDIMPINMSEIPNGLILQKGAFLCAEDDIELKVKFTKKISAWIIWRRRIYLARSTRKWNDVFRNRWRPNY